jgi:hypothetical protein
VLLPPLHHLWSSGRGEWRGVRCSRCSAHRLSPMPEASAEGEVDDRPIELDETDLSADAHL